MGPAVVAVAFAAGGAIVQAQDWRRPDTGRSTLAVPPSAPATPLSAGQPAEAQPQTASRQDERAADHLLGLAQRDIAEGGYDIAQRTLEQLVARYPGAATAAQARRLLHSIYARQGLGGGGATAATSDSRSRPGAPARDAAPIDAARDGRAAAGVSGQAAPWQTNELVLTVVQDAFRNEVGDRIFFSAGSARLGARARLVLAGQVRWLARYPHMGLVIEGHADDRSAGGDDEALASERAEAVRQRLVEEGLGPERLVLRGFGSRQRIATCDSSDCAAQNRRVVLVPDFIDAPSPAYSQAGGSDDRAAVRPTVGRIRGYRPAGADAN